MMTFAQLYAALKRRNARAILYPDGRITITPNPWDLRLAIAKHYQELLVVFAHKKIISYKGDHAEVANWTELFLKWHGGLVKIRQDDDELIKYVVEHGGVVI